MIFGSTTVNRKGANKQTVTCHHRLSKALPTGARYALLKNENNLTAKQESIRDSLCLPNLNLTLQIRETFQQLYAATSKEDFESTLKKWYFWATHSRLEPMIKAPRP